MPNIIILSGIPCSGKSTFAKIKEENYTYISLSRDEIRENFFQEPYHYCNFNEKKVTEIFDKNLNILLTNDNNIIIDNTNCKDNYLFDLIRNIEKKYTEYNVYVVFFDISLIKAHFRNILRYIKTGKWIPIKVLNNFYKNYQKIDKDKYSKYILHK